jgi:hypothetical protein
LPPLPPLPPAADPPPPKMERMALSTWPLPAAAAAAAASRSLSPSFGGASVGGGNFKMSATCGEASDAQESDRFLPLSVQTACRMVTFFGRMQHLSDAEPQA